LKEENVRDMGAMKKGSERVLVEASCD